MSKWVRILGGTAIVATGLFAILILQFYFDRGDIKKASRFLNEFRPWPGREQNLLTAMALEAGIPEDDLACSSELRSRTEGLVLMRCGPKTAPETFEWMINLVSYRVTPNNAPAQSLLLKGERDEKEQTHRSPDGGR